MLRQPLLMLSRSDKVKNFVTAMPVSSSIVARYVPGEGTDDAVAASSQLIDSGLHVTLDFLGEDTLDREQAESTVHAYLEVLGALGGAGLARNSEVSVKLSAIGQALPDSGEKLAIDNARTICHAARNAGTTVTLDMEDHTTTDSTLSILRELRKDFPETGAVVQAYLHRTEADCRDLAYEGSRVRLCKGAYSEPESVAFQDKHDVDRSFVRRLAASPQEQRLTGAIITLAKTLGLRTIAEGIEEAGHATRLSELGCDAGQGFLFSRPVAVDDLTDALASGSQRMSHGLAVHASAPDEARL